MKGGGVGVAAKQVRGAGVVDGAVASEKRLGSEGGGHGACAPERPAQNNGGAWGCTAGKQALREGREGGTWMQGGIGLWRGAGVSAEVLCTARFSQKNGQGRGQSKWSLSDESTWGGRLGAASAASRKGCESCARGQRPGRWLLPAARGGGRARQRAKEAAGTGDESGHVGGCPDCCEWDGSGGTAGKGWKKHARGEKASS